MPCTKTNVECWLSCNKHRIQYTIRKTGTVYMLLIELTSQSSDSIKRQRPCENIIIKATISSVCTFSFKRQVQRTHGVTLWGIAMETKLKPHSIYWTKYTTSASTINVKLKGILKPISAVISVHLPIINYFNEHQRWKFC